MVRHEGLSFSRYRGQRQPLFHYAFGDTDLYVIADFPDHAAVTSLVLTVTATGGITCRTTVLMKPEEIDEAVKKTLSYRPPGQ